MTRGRDAALDNLKGLLIISVVYVHLYDMLGQKTPLLFTIRTIVLAVQMPLVQEALFYRLLHQLVSGEKWGFLRRCPFLPTRRWSACT